MAFVTGSQVYGTPHDKSDVDLVVLLPSAVIEALRVHSEDKGTLRFGKLNVLALAEGVVEHEEFYAKWEKVTQELIERKPVTREQAIEARIAAGIGCLPKGVYE